MSTNTKLIESNTAQNGIDSKVGICLALLSTEIPKVTTFPQRCRNEDCCAIWIYMLTVHSSPASSSPSPLLKNIPNENPVGPFAQYLRDMLCVYSHVRCGFCKKIKNRKPSGWKRSYFGREAKKTRAHTKWLWAWTPNWRFMGGDVDSSYLYFSLLISFCVTICVKVAKKYMPQKSIAENRVWTSAEKGKMRSNSKNHLPGIR